MMKNIYFIKIYIKIKNYIKKEGSIFLIEKL